MKKDIFYIYQYKNKLTGEPIYIGKGKDNRKESHLLKSYKGERSILYDAIRALNYENGVSISTLRDSLTEEEALSLEVEYIERIGRVNIGTGPLLNLTPGGEGISGGIDKYGYKRKGIARKITDMVDKGMLIQDMPKLLRNYVSENNIKAKSVEERIIPHLREMGNVGYHYKGPNKYLLGWQFSLDGTMIDINHVDLETPGFLKVHGELPFNKGFVANGFSDF